MIRFELVSAESRADYIRHARLETLKAIRLEPSPALVEPIESAVYTVAVDTAKDRPVGLTECFFHHGRVASYSNLPFASVADLSAYCPFHLMSGIRTLYVEPEYRVRHPLFLHLCLCAAYVFRTMGAWFATATTDAANGQLDSLYEKLGGRRLGTFRSDVTGAREIALYLFDLDHMVCHRALDRVRRRLTIDFHRLHMARRSVGALEGDDPGRLRGPGSIARPRPFTGRGHPGMLSDEIPRK